MAAYLPKISKNDMNGNVTEKGMQVGKQMSNWIGCS